MHALAGGKSRFNGVLPYARRCELAATTDSGEGGSAESRFLVKVMSSSERLERMTLHIEKFAKVDRLHIFAHSESLPVSMITWRHHAHGHSS